MPISEHTPVSEWLRKIFKITAFANFVRQPWQQLTPRPELELFSWGVGVSTQLCKVPKRPLLHSFVTEFQVSLFKIANLAQRSIFSSCLKCCRVHEHGESCRTLSLRNIMLETLSCVRRWSTFCIRSISHAYLSSGAASSVRQRHGIFRTKTGCCAISSLHV